MAYLMRNTLKLLTTQQLFKSTNGFALKQREHFSTSTFGLWQKQNTARNASGGETTTTNAQTKPKDTSIKITLIQNQNMTVTGLEEAQNLAKRRSMHLVKVQDMDTKTQRPVYKLLTAAERLQEELSELKSPEKSSDKASQKKSDKTLNIGARISEHDLASRLKNISKWLGKRHEVRILIQGTERDMVSCEKIYKAIEESVKTPETIGKVVQKRIKGSVIKFSILPIKPASEKETSSEAQ